MNSRMKSRVNSRRNFWRILGGFLEGTPTGLLAGTLRRFPQETRGGFLRETPRGTPECITREFPEGMSGDSPDSQNALMIFFQ